MMRVAINKLNAIANKIRLACKAANRVIEVVWDADGAVGPLISSPLNAAALGGRLSGFSDMARKIARST